jgi:hypothetical protein
MFLSACHQSTESETIFTSVSAIGSPSNAVFPRYSFRYSFLAMKMCHANEKARLGNAEPGCVK